MEKFLKSMLDEIQINLDEQQISKFLKYMDFLSEYNQKINLTAIDQKEDIIIKHFIDSLIVAKFINLDQTKNIIDVGTGAGFPGVPLKIYKKDVNMTLIDATNKKIIFLKNLIEHLDLFDIQCIHARAEELSRKPDFRENFDLCVCRAVASFRILCELCLPFLEKNGKFVALKSIKVFEEIDQSLEIIKILGGEISDIKEICLPNSQAKRVIVIINKLYQTPTEYPRNMNKISKIAIK